MKLKVLSPRKSLNKAFLKVKPVRSEIEDFKDNLAQLLDRIDEDESEEFHKNLVIKFLNDTWYHPGYFINTKDRKDLVIHTGKNAKDPVGVIIEAKRPTNKAEMISAEKPNAKALHEIMLYYLTERVDGEQKNIKFLIVTNIYEWYLFDEVWFEKHVFRNTKLIKEYKEWKQSGHDTRYFYESIARPFLETLPEEVPCTRFNFLEYRDLIEPGDKKEDTKLVALFKILSPQHLLKLSFTNDSNTLDKPFYTELLHIIGLEETKQGSKKVIRRREEGKRDPGSFIENVIEQLVTLDKLPRIPNLNDYGDTTEERLYHVALELTITWINRILFLKLLEAQLIRYQGGDSSFAFLDREKVHNFDDLNTLFFRVLARRLEDRKGAVTDRFAHVPYLNSSLFEPTELEHTAILISNLEDEVELALHPGTVLKEETGKKKKGRVFAIEYLFEFLDAYDFSSEGSEDIQEDNKTLINASVLGLIFEKINGYKDGSFFTPGFITMYMARETVRRAVAQKFKDHENDQIETYDDVKAYSYKYFKPEDIKRFNDLINSLKICDPAVGSGHFLVSALNEILAIKSDLGILADKKGISIKYHAEVENDELILTDTEGHLFEYIPTDKESQRIQETLFLEKQTIIENCLFGVDINPNSVKICRLRLWIELLKNAYYKSAVVPGPVPGPPKRELETLPNIDINIKCGNSLISRFPLDADLGDALKKSKWTIDSYRLAVQTYREATSKEEKHQMEKLIADIKSDFRSEINKNDKKVIRLNKLRGELFNLTNQQNLFGMSEKEKKRWNKDVDKKTKDIEKLESEIEEIKSNKIYEHAFEWRFEFPEVLDEEGNFIGFDVVIGNPPYIRQELLGSYKIYFNNNYAVYSGTGDIYFYFYELSFGILKKLGIFSFINNTFDKTNAGKVLRKYLTDSYSIITYIDFTSVIVFEEATTYPIVIIVRKESKSQQTIKFLKIYPDSYSDIDRIFSLELFYNIPQKDLNQESWNFLSTKEKRLYEKIISHKTILDQFGKCYRGIVTGYNEAFIINTKEKELITNNSVHENDLIKPLLEGKDLDKWQIKNIDKWIVFTRRGTDIDQYPLIKKHLESYKKKLSPKKNREDKFGRKPGKYKWFEIQDSIDYYKLFEKPKIIWPNLQNENKFSYDDNGKYINAPGVIFQTTNKYLLAFLNSKVTWYFLKSICVIRSGGYIEVKPQYFEQIPIPEISDSDKIILTQKVENIIKEKTSNPICELLHLEKEIDQLVYRLYGLTEEEIRIVEG